MKQFPPKDILPLLLFPLANSALSYTQSSSLFSVREIFMQHSLAQTENILTLFPKVNVSIEPAHQLEITLHEPTPAFSVANWTMRIADKLGRTGHSQLRAAEWARLPVSSSVPAQRAAASRSPRHAAGASAWRNTLQTLFLIMINNRRRNINISSGFVTSVLLGDCLD